MGSAVKSIFRTALVALFVGFVVAALFDLFGLDGDPAVVAAVLAVCVLDQKAQAKGRPA